MLRFFVRDTGIGIDSDKINGLFSAFSQADSYMSRKYGGSGLGLAICKRLVELMGGEITAESRPGSGSTFMFTVCFKSCDISEMQVITPPRELSEMKVLVVDDCSTARHIILNLLKGLSFKTFAVASGEESIKEVEQRTLSPDNKPYDIVFMDWKMKGMNGIDASHIIKTGLNLPRPPKIIMLTAFGKEYILKKASQAGIDGFLTKPVTPSTIFDAVMELVGKKTMAKNLPFMKESKLTEALGTIRDAKILVVEDNKVNQLLARKLLENVNLKVTLADNGAEAIERLRNNEFDAVLMDIQMPVMNGYEATKAIREADESFSSIPVIAMTAHAMTGEREKCIEAGMSDYVTKPVNPEVLYTTLIRWISDRADS